MSLDSIRYWVLLSVVGDIINLHEGKGFVDYVKSEDPDILCLQETKIEAGKVKADLLPGYHHHFYAAEKKGYAGTAYVMSHGINTLSSVCTPKSSPSPGQMELESLTTTLRGGLSPPSLTSFTW